MDDDIAYMSTKEIKELDRLLTYKDCLKDTISCWEATRINGASASLACDGNISISLLKAFDRISELERKNNV